MTVELVRVVTSDRLYLEGALHLPAPGVVNPLRLTPCSWCMGRGGIFIRTARWNRSRCARRKWVLPRSGSTRADTTG